MFHVYFAKSLKNGKVYVGHTGKEPEERVKEHNNSANEWSKNNKPFKLIYYERYSCKEDAVSREKFYKTGFGKRIKYLIIDSLGA
ncbi:MAG: GIY-YIG nuclease family protein [Candidatus Levyibacteriota bacterium]